MVAAEIGESHRFDRHAFVAILRQAVARCFVGDMSDAFTSQPAQVGQESHDVRRGKTCRNAFVRRRHTQRTDAGGRLAAHAPDLAGHLDAGGLAVGSRYSDDMGGHGGEEPRRQPCEYPARFVMRDMRCAFDLRSGPCDHRYCSGLDCSGYEVLTVDLRTLERAEDGARRDLAMVDGEAGDFPLALAVQPRVGTQPRQLHRLASGMRGSRSEMSMSRVLSGRRPSIGPMRGTSRPTMGAAVQPAVR